MPNLPSPQPTVPHHPAWVWWLPLLTLVLQSTLFLGMNWRSTEPIDFWPLSFVCLVPWVVTIVIPAEGRRVAVLSYGLGIAFYLVNMHYIRVITVPGYIALGVYFGAYYLLFAIALRWAYRRRRLPLTLLVPVLWVAGEYARGIGPLAFPFLFLSHGAYRCLTLIQISDVFGAYGVSFVIAMVNGLLADGVLSRLAAAAGRPLFGPMLTTLLVVSATLLYGIIQGNRATLAPGPRIAVLQADYQVSVDPSKPRISEAEKAQTYFHLMRQAAEARPNLILFPETPWLMALNPEFLKQATFSVNPPYYEAYQQVSRTYDALLHDAADHYQAGIVIGAGSIEFPATHYPSTLKYNSAFVYTPGSATKGRYDKVALVMFGEYTPFRYGRGHFLYRWLDSFNPFSSPDDEFSLTPGREFTVFGLADDAGGPARYFGVAICFEDLIPKVSRRFAAGSPGHPPVDFLLSISNDGWFNHGPLVPQHLAVCVFRAVENRIGIARSVNTACSGFVDPDGRIHDVVRRHERMLGPGIFGFAVARVLTDSRRTVYTRFGDWFGWLCAVLGAVTLSSAVLGMGRRGAGS